MSKNVNKRKLKVKRLNEPKFTEKRNPYKKYQKAKWKWIDIFYEINSLKDVDTINIMKNTSEKYGINYGTLRNKYNKFKNDTKYNDFNKENRGTHKKNFTNEEEKEIFLFIKENFIDKSRVLCNDIIKIYARKKFKEQNPNKIFKASDGWCDMFKKRWKLSTVKISTSKIASTIYTDKEINIFLDECKNTLLEVGPNFFST